MARINKRAGDRPWAFYQTYSVRIPFDLHPEAHTLLHLAGKDAAEIMRQALKEFAINHGHPAADPAVQAQVSGGQIQPTPRATTQIPEPTPRALQKIEPPKAPPPAAAPPPQVARAEERPAHATASTQTPKPRPKLDFGEAPNSEGVPESEPAQSGQTLNDPLAAHHNKWFKDEDQY